MERTMMTHTGKFWRISLGCMLLTLVSLLPCYGQAGRGGISGTVTDSSGAIIPNAMVEITNVATNVHAQMKTSSAGVYAISALIPGIYRVTVSQQGFQKAVREGVPVEVDRITTINVMLQVGSTTQTVTVTATAAALLNTTNSTVGQLISRKTLESVPLNGRDALLLVQLSPGVIPPNGSLNATGAANRPGIEVSAFRYNGQPEGSVAYVLDGSPLTVAGYGTSSSSPAFSPPLDDVQEFRVETNNVSPTVASAGSAVISMVTKSGTDHFHGSAFTFVRPDALDANDPFTKASQAQLGLPNEPPGFHRYQWGGSVGGPIRKGKFFFFGDYEGTQTRSLSTLTTTVPTAAERNGDFSSIPTIYNPFDVNAQGQRQPFSGNMIPSGMINPVSIAMTKLIPMPNQAGVGPYHDNNYFDSGLFPDDAKKFDIRLDDNVSSKQQIFGRYSFADLNTGVPDYYHNGADPSFYTSLTRGQNILLADNYTMSPNTLLQVRYSFTRHAEDQPAPSDIPSLTDLGFPASLASQAAVQTIPEMAISGMHGVGNRQWSTGFKFISMNHDAIVAIDTVRGRHDLKMGFEYRKDLENMGQPISPSGVYGFDTTATSSTTFANDGFGYASFLLGMGNPFESNNFTQDAFVAEASPYYAAYLEDNIRVTTKLNVNVGVRWEIFGGRSERYNRLEYFSPDASFTVNGVGLTGGEVFVKSGGSPFTTNLTNFGPRLGLAYQATHNLVLHAGAGIFYGPSAHSVGLPFTDGDGFSSTTVWKATTYDQFGNSIMLNPLNDPFPNGLVPMSGSSEGLATNLGNSLATVPRSQPEPVSYNWNAGLEYQLPHGILVSGAFVGSRGMHQVLSNGAAGPNLNQLSLAQISQYNTQLNSSVPNPYVNAITNPSAPFYGSPTIPLWQALAPYPQFTGGSPGSGVNLNASPLAESFYNAGQFQVQKRLSGHFSTLLSLTLGKIISTGVGPYSYVLSNAGYQDWRDRYLDRSVDPQDVSRWVSWALFYDLPVGSGRAINTQSKWADLAFGHWTLNTVLSWSTGVPIVVSGSFPNRSQFFNQRPNLTCDAAAGAPHTAAQWFLPNCYAAPASPFVPGTAPRTLSDVRGDGTHNLDLSIFKNVGLGENKNLQFRAEFFNFTNSVQLGLPNRNWNPNDLSTFGQITYAASTPRQVQLAVRFTF
jgi:Carboxypeptidase regulatory-like domain/TonB dependent receptor-like, beta-barrel